MTINLQKRQTISLTKSAPGLKKIMLGLGWDAAVAVKAKTEKKGFFSGLLSSVPAVTEAPSSIDLDASCVMFDANKNLVDTVWFRQLKSKDGSVVHTGDNMTGEGTGDDESILVDLEALPSNVETLVFVITSFRGQKFTEVESAFCRVVDTSNGKNGKELARFELSEKVDKTANIIAKVSREGGTWSMTALGVPTEGRNQSDLMVDMLKQL